MTSRSQTNSSTRATEAQPKAKPVKNSDYYHRMLARDVRNVALGNNESSQKLIDKYSKALQGRFHEKAEFLEIVDKYLLDLELGRKYEAIVSTASKAPDPSDQRRTISMDYVEKFTGALTGFCFHGEQLHMILHEGPRKPYHAVSISALSYLGSKSRGALHVIHNGEELCYQVNGRDRLVVKPLRK